MGDMPVDKAIFWPLSQEFPRNPAGGALRGASGSVSRLNQAPLEGEAVDQAPLLPVLI
jgi:hypothetical protein